ncbi:cytochrome P450 [Macrolepiota fuliginosa MF-IS2]|uniref:Cytochrome P450 n=1 Tax=Macrolepiota fuliginosa MF-IS2 TaxID=1400762 RepID=A0A9P6C7C9_9AGAR|nr:cytochrome P450 [Macrolepiota fuliginosa MF-IS2]
MFSALFYNVFLFSCGVALVLFVRFAYDLVSARLLLRHIPGPKPSSYIWGEEWNLYNSSPGQPYAMWHGRYGNVVKFRGAFGHQVVSLTDHTAISFILGENAYLFPKAKGVRAWFKAMLGEGILWVEGKEEHERQRKLLAPALSSQAVRNMAPILFETSAKLAAQWMKILDHQHVDSAEIEITDWAGRFALDTIGRAAFTYDFDFLSQEKIHPDSLVAVLDSLTNTENKKSSFYMRALFWLFPSILNIGRKGEMIRRTKQELGSIGSRMWHDAKTVGDHQGRTMMAFMLKADAAAATDVSKGDVIAQMRTVISAGYETVSAVVAWMLYELAQHPQVQDEIREEVQRVRHDSIDVSETISIPLEEPIPGTRETQIVIPKGTLLAIPLNVVHQDPEVWGPDAHIFRPERWLERKKSQLRHKHELLTFSEGPRACIGKAFAVAEIKVLMVTLLRQFSFSCEYEIEAFQSFVIRPRIKGQGTSSLPLLIRKL